MYNIPGGIILTAYEAKNITVKKSYYFFITPIVNFETYFRKKIQIYTKEFQQLHKNTKIYVKYKSDFLF